MNYSIAEKEINGDGEERLVHIQGISTSLDEAKVKLVKSQRDYPEAKFTIVTLIPSKK